MQFVPYFSILHLKYIENTLVIAFESVKHVNQIVTIFKMFKIQNILKRNRKCHLFPLVTLANTYNLCLMIQSVCTFQQSNMTRLHVPSLHSFTCSWFTSVLFVFHLTLYLIYCTTCKALLKQMSCKNWVLWLFCLFCASCLIWISHLHIFNKPIGA